MADAKTQAAEPGPILDLSTLAPERPTIKVDHDLYELKLLEHDFSAQQHADFQRDLSEFDELWSQKKRTNADGKRMSALLERLFGAALVDAKPLRDKLTEEQKRSVVITFQYAPALAAAQAQPKTTAVKAGETDSTTAS